MPEIAKAVRQFVVDSFFYRENGTPFTDTTSFLETGLIDSTGVLELVGFLEKSYAFRIHDDEIVPENLDSVQRIVAFVRAKTRAPLQVACHPEPALI